jgi:DNA-binding NtrC family response regulator
VLLEDVMQSIFVLSKEGEVSNVIYSCLRSKYSVDTAPDKDAAMQMLRKKRYDLLFIDVEALRELSDHKEIKPALYSIWQFYPTIQVVVMSSRSMIRDAVMAVKEGASDYLTYPIDPEELIHVTESVYESIITQSELDYLRDRFWEADSLDIIQTKSPVMRIVFDKIRSVAPTKSTVLLIGETGTGKSVLAKLIHRHSNRRVGKFISVHCGAIPDTLLESELFGHEKGAFTGADRRKLGKFEVAHGGTIFLDEIGTVTPSAQIKLLQILQDGTFQRVGGVETLQSDVRILAATNMGLKEMCEDGRFRKDLYYRLNVFPVEIPPLRDRVEDINHLVKGFLRKMNKFNTKEIHDIHPEVMEAFHNYPWPGNIRELENLLERAYILETSSVLTPETFPSELFSSKAPLGEIPGDSSLTLSEVRRKAVQQIENRYIKDLLAQNKGRIKVTAQLAGITTRQLHKLMTKYGIRKEEFK